MGLGSMLGPEPDEDYLALTKFCRDHCRLLGQGLFPDEPAALKKVTVDVTGDYLVIFAVFSEADLKGRIAAADVNIIDEPATADAWAAAMSGGSRGRGGRDLAAAWDRRLEAISIHGRKAVLNHVNTRPMAGGPPMEVPAAQTVEECWQMVEAAGQANRHCAILENYCYFREVMCIVSMLRQGVLGEPMRVYAGYQKEAMYYSVTENNTLTLAGEGRSIQVGNCYPTHYVGPSAKWLDINCGDQCISRLWRSWREEA